MKILHTADWHLGKKLGSFDRIEEQQLVLEEICQRVEEERIDVVIIAGDLFDTFNPPSDALELFYKTVRRLSNDSKRAVIAIAGNHDSPERIEAPIPLAKECGIILVGFPYSVPSPLSLPSGIALTKVDKGFLELALPTVDFPLRIILSPYANELRLKEYLGNNNAQALSETLAEHWKHLADKYCTEEGVNILLAHLLMYDHESDVPQEPEDEKSINYIGGASAIPTRCIPLQIQYTALGHLHRKQLLSGHVAPVAYSGSILEYSFSEANQQKYIVVVEAVPQKPVDLTFIPLQKGYKLKRVVFDDEQAAVAWLEQNQDIFVELTFQSESYMQASTKKRFLDTHARIVHLIPQLTERRTGEITSTQHIDPQKHINELFVEYFTYKKNQKPSAELMELFQEIINFDAQTSK